MTAKIDHAELDAALRRCGSTWGGSQAHGMLCGRLAVHGADGAMRKYNSQQNVKDLVKDFIPPIALKLARKIKGN